ncbi:MAG: family 16 glycosylhydrolase [Bacteroidota bacterium]
MKRFKFFMLFLGLGLALLSSSLVLTSCEKEAAEIAAPIEEQIENQEIESRNTSGWTLKWTDDFNSFNNSRWTKINAPGGINNELTYIRPNNVYTSNGQLVIKTDDDGYGSGANYRQYTSGKVISKGKFDMKYGRVDVRMKMAMTPGTHNAAWLLHKPCDGVNPCLSWPPELDIIEVIGREPGKAHQTIHTSTQYRGRCDWSPQTGQCSPNKYQNGKTTNINTGNYNTFSIEWEPNEVRWYINNNLRHTFTQNGVDQWSPDEFMYIILDCTVGGDWAQSPNGSSTWPQFTYVDWIKVYEKSGGGGGGGSISNGNYRIKNVASGRYLTSDGSSTEWITPYQASLGNNWGSQKWTVNSTGNGYFTLKCHWPSNRYLTANNNGSGTQNVYQAALGNNWGSQKWKAVDIGNGQYRIEPSWPTNVTLTTPNNNNWSYIKQQSSQGNNREKWIFESI